MALFCLQPQTAAGPKIQVAQHYMEWTLLRDFFFLCTFLMFPNHFPQGQYFPLNREFIFKNTWWHVVLRGNVHVLEIWPATLCSSWNEGFMPFFLGEQFTDITGWFNTCHRAQKNPVFFVSWPLSVRARWCGDIPWGPRRPPQQLRLSQTPQLRAGSRNIEL